MKLGLIDLFHVLRIYIDPIVDFQLKFPVDIRRKVVRIVTQG